MFSPKQWILACVDCQKSLSLGRDSVKNLVDYRGRIISVSRSALRELLKFSEDLGISFVCLEAINTFLVSHVSHHLRLSPITDDTFEGFEEVNMKNISSNHALHLFCQSCTQSSALSPLLVVPKPISRRKMSVHDIEKFNQVLELYNLLGCTVDHHRQALDLEALLPFLKRHAGHALYYETMSIKASESF